MYLYCPNPDCPHFEATGEPAEYRLGTAQCRDCGTGLVERKPEAIAGKDTVGTVEYEEFVPVFTPQDAGMIAFVKSLLQSADIRFFVKNERVQHLFGFGGFGAGFNPITGPPVVLVEPDRADEARELLAEIDREGDERGEPE